MVRYSQENSACWKFTQKADYAYRAEDYDRLYISRKSQTGWPYTPPPNRKTRNGKRRNRWKRDRFDCLIETQMTVLNTKQ